MRKRKSRSRPKRYISRRRLGGDLLDFMPGGWLIKGVGKLASMVPFSQLKSMADARRQQLQQGKGLRGRGMHL